MLRITIRRREKPLKPSLHDDMDWICRSLGLVSNRDSSETSIKVFRSIVKSAMHDRELSSDDIAKRAGVTRGAAVHHLKSYIDSGLIIEENRRYFLRARSVEASIERMEQDMLRALGEIKKIAREIDEQLGLRERR